MSTSSPPGRSGLAVWDRYSAGWATPDWSPLPRFGSVVLILALTATATALLGLLPGPAALLIVAAMLAGAARGVFTLLQATAISDRWGATHYGRLNGLLSAPALLATAPAPWAGAALAQALGGYPPVFASSPGWPRSARPSSPDRTPDLDPEHPYGHPCLASSCPHGAYRGRSPHRRSRLLGHRHRRFQAGRRRRRTPDPAAGAAGGQLRLPSRRRPRPARTADLDAVGRRLAALGVSTPVSRTRSA